MKQLQELANTIYAALGLGMHPRHLAWCIVGSWTVAIGSVGCVDQRSSGAFPARVEVVGTDTLAEELLSTPRDAIKFDRSTAFVLTADHEIIVYNTDLANGVVASRSLSPKMETDRLTGFVRRGDSLWVWDPVQTLLHPLWPDTGDPLPIPAGANEDLFVGSFRVGGPPRSHHRPLRMGDRFLLERRSIREQFDSLVVPGYIVAVKLRTGQEDTLVAFRASGYGHRRGNLIICCGPPPIFSPQAHWSLVARSTIAFASGRDDIVKLIDIAGDSNDSIRTHVSPSDVDYGTRIRYALQRADQPTSIERGRYALQLLASGDRFAEAFSEEAPTITQMLIPTYGLIAIRHFDSSAPPHGLSRDWSFIDIDTRSIVQLELPFSGVVHDMDLAGDTLFTLWSKSSDQTDSAFLLHSRVVMNGLRDN